MNTHSSGFSQYRKLGIASATLGVAMMAASANAQFTIYDTTGGNTTFSYPGYEIGPGPVYTEAESFGVNAPMNLHSVTLLLSPDDSDPYTVQLTKAGNTEPGSVLDSWTTYGSSSAITLNPNGFDLLNVGTYDIVVSSASMGAWQINNSINGSFQFYGPDGWSSTTGPLAEMKITATPAATPEPAPLVAMGLGMFSLLLRKRSRVRMAA